MVDLNFGNLIMYPVNDRLTPCRVVPVGNNTVLHNCVAHITLKPTNSSPITLRLTNKVATTITHHNPQFKIKSYEATL